MHTVRAIAGALAVAVVAACGPASPPGTTDPDGAIPSPGVTEGPVPPGGEPTPPPGAPATAGEDAAPPDGATGTGATGDGATGDDGAAAERTPLDDLAPVGFNGRAMLRGDRPRLVVEIDVQEGLSPSQEAIDHLVATLAEHADKPAGITLTGGNTFSSDRTGWTAADLRAVASTHRSTSSGDEVVSVYVLYVRGGFVDDGEETSAIGVAHRASEVALFPERWRDVGDLLGSGRRVERAVLLHEVGHLLGLVELNYTSDHDRRDPEHPGHSRNRGSVMHWAVETTIVGQIFEGPPPDRFDAADADDLAALREGR